MVKQMRDAALAAVLTVLAGAGICAAMPMEYDDDMLPKEFAPYEMISDEGTYEVREYEPATWACSVRGKIKSKREMMMMFVRLIQYINGENSLGEELAMTGPMTMYKEMSELTGIKKIEMCYYLPTRHQTSPPTPTVEDVVINRKDTMKVAVRSFLGKKLSMEDWEIQKFMLQKDLKQAGVKVVNYENCFGTMYYDPEREEYVTEIWYEMQE
ncbi:heme-binding protein 2-like isoform X1 [Portunus trituberculatus]|uniref:heme-binding protein 2-like isoform X1 n=1 Tax=Portunus trituberculatus TaxID=210409 RepID=UPI001E1CF1D3|nr:heme-binding protein 2-like isoform X1 [Portunus trituberculatus]